LPGTCATFCNILSCTTCNAVHTEKLKPKIDPRYSTRTSPTVVRKLVGIVVISFVMRMSEKITWIGNRWSRINSAIMVEYYCVLVEHAALNYISR